MKENVPLGPTDEEEISVPMRHNDKDDLISDPPMANLAVLLHAVTAETTRNASTVVELAILKNHVAHHARYAGLLHILAIHALKDAPHVRLNIVAT